MTLLFADENLYSALLTRDEAYDGFCFVCVKTTKIFCKLSCGARKPLQSNVEFVKTSEDAINKGYRACKMCKPLDIGKPKSQLTEKLINLVRENPENRWTADDVTNLGVDSSTIRRAFKRDFGVTFLQYAREHRLGSVVKNIKAGDKIIDAQ